MDFKKFIGENHPDPDALLLNNFEQMCLLAEKYAKSLQLRKADVSGCYIERICDSCNTGYIPELYRDSDGKQAIVNFQDCPNCGKRDDIWVKVHVDNNR